MKRATVISLLAATFTAVGISLADPSMPGTPRWRNASGFIAVDADTIKSPAGVRYHLLGYDAPKTATAECIAELDAATQAKRRLQQLIDTGAARLVETGKYDQRGRVLARLTIAGADVAVILIAERLVRPAGGGIRPSWCERGQPNETPASGRPIPPAARTTSRGKR